LIAENEQLELENERVAKKIKRELRAEERSEVEAGETRQDQPSCLRHQLK